MDLSIFFHSHEVLRKLTRRFDVVRYHDLWSATDRIIERDKEQGPFHWIVTHFPYDDTYNYDRSFESIAKLSRFLKTDSPGSRILVFSGAHPRMLEALPAAYDNVHALTRDVSFEGAWDAAEFNRILGIEPEGGS
ncbi:hypothetical protein ACFL2T_01010 [Elusimicrobiota bacterium]